MSSGWVVAAAVLIGLPLVSYTVEWLRRAPVTPERLSWAPNIRAAYLTVGGTRLRYITAGQGPALVLLHTLRTQLDMFQRVVPPLAKHFRVYALDYPGHGYSGIPGAEYTPDFFVASVGGFLEALQIKDAVVVGEQRRADPRRHVHEAPPVPDRETHPRGRRLSAGLDATGPGARDVRSR